MNILEIKNLKFSYEENQNVINDVSFILKKGQYICLIGPNGSGKSTIAKLILGLLEKKSGDIAVCGLPLNFENIIEIRKKVGIVFQNPDNQFIGSTVEDDIAFGLENHLVASEDMPKIISKFSQEVGMSEFLKSEPSKLSGGQKQRVAIAGVLAMEPDLIIFDEATSMLDPKGKREIIDITKKLHREKEKTILSITHDMQEVLNSDYVLVLNHGKIILQGTPFEIFNHQSELENAKMELPFIMDLKNELINLGIDLGEIISEEEMVEKLWQLSL